MRRTLKQQADSKARWLELQAGTDRSIEIDTLLEAITLERSRITKVLADAELGASTLRYGAMSYMDSLAHIGIHSLRDSTKTRLEALHVERMDLEREDANLRAMLRELRAPRAP